MNEFEELLSSLENMSTFTLVLLFDNTTNKTDEELLLRDKIMDILEKRDSNLFEMYLNDDTSNKIGRYFR